MLILTNIFRINGAGVICYDGLLKIIADMAGGNHIMSTVVYMKQFVMSEKTWLDEQVLQEMVYSVNREEVPADEILSDHPFRYERENEQALYDLKLHGRVYRLHPSLFFVHDLVSAYTKTDSMKLVVHMQQYH